MEPKRPPYRWLETIGSLDGVVPVRKLHPTPVKNTGRVATRKATKAQQFESLLEQDFLILLDADDRVERIGVQPLTIRWVGSDGKQRSYTPDVVVHYSERAQERDPTLCTTLFEIKPRALIKLDWDEWRIKFRAAIAWARQHNCRFKLITEVEIRTPYLENKRTLRHFTLEALGLSDPTAHETSQLILKSVAGLGHTTPRALLSAISTGIETRALAIPYLWLLLNEGYIEADLNEKITMSSPIWPTARMKASP